MDKIMIRVYGLACFLLFSLNVSGQVYNNCVTGRATYYDVDEGIIKPIVNARIRIETYSPTISLPETCTDSEGNFGVNIGPIAPEQVTARLFFENSYINLQLFSTTHADYSTVFKEPLLGFELYRNYKCNFNYTEGKWNDLAKIFSMGNLAHDFAVLNGYNPELVYLRYPAEDALTDPNGIFTLPAGAFVEGSFYWPFTTDEAVPDVITGLLTVTFGAIGYLYGTSVVIKENSIYLAKNTSKAGKRQTVFHEYGHHIMKGLRRSGGKTGWPISSRQGYVFPLGTGSEPFAHSFNQYNQTEKQAFIEGWADFFGSAVESYSYPYSNPFGGTEIDRYTGVYKNTNLFEFTSSYTTEFFNFNSVTSGLKNEVTIGSAIFDLYDTPNMGDSDGFQFGINSCQNLFQTLKSGDNIGFDFFRNIYRQNQILDYVKITNSLSLNKVNALLIEAPQNLGNSVNAQGNPILTWTHPTPAAVKDYQIYKLITTEIGYQLLTSTTNNQFTDITETLTNNVSKSHTVKYFVCARDQNDLQSIGSNVLNLVVSGMSMEKQANTIETINEPRVLCYPNPFNPSFNISINLNIESNADIFVYNIIGQIVYSKKDLNLPIGSTTFLIDGSSFASGNYFVRVNLGEKQISKALVLIR